MTIIKIKDIIFQLKIFLNLLILKKATNQMKSLCLYKLAT